MKVEKTLEERGNRYGDYRNVARTAQEIKSTMRCGASWNIMSDDKKESMDMIANKIARAVNGDPEYADNYHDIGGYAKLAEDRCEGILTREEFDNLTPFQKMEHCMKFKKEAKKC